MPLYEETIEETFDSSDLIAGNLWITSTIADLFAVEDTSVGNLFRPESIAESVVFADIPYIGDSPDSTFPLWILDVSELLSLIDTQTNNRYGTEIAADGFLFYDNALISWAEIIADDIILDDLSLPFLGINVSDLLNLVDSQTNNWYGTEIVPTEILNLLDLPVGSIIINRSIEESLGLADTVTIGWIVQVLDYMQFTDLANAIGTFQLSTVETLGLADETAWAFGKLIEEVLSLVDTNSVLATFLSSIAESLGLTDESISKLSISKVISETLTLTDTSETNLHAIIMVQDMIALSVMVELEGDVWECYVLNTPKFFPSVYSGFNFNSYCVDKIDGKTYACNDTGIYELAGDTDAGNTIHTGVVLSETDFGMPNQKRFRRGYLGISGNSPVMVFETETGEREVYTIDTQGKTVMSSGLKSKTWKISVADFDELDYIKLLPVVLTK